MLIQLKYGVYRDVRQDKERSSALNCLSTPDPTDTILIDPCKLSIKLLVRVRELLRSTFSSSSADTLDSSVLGLGLDNLLTLKVTPDLFDTLLNTSAFSEFEYETCQLQLISLGMVYMYITYTMYMYTTVCIYMYYAHYCICILYVYTIYYIYYMSTYTIYTTHTNTYNYV